MEIQKNIPVPDNAAPIFYPFAKMEIGDSVTATGTHAGKRLAGAARVYASRHLGWACVTRKIEGDATRVWRVRWRF